MSCHHFTSTWLAGNICIRMCSATCTFATLPTLPTLPSRTRLASRSCNAQVYPLCNVCWLLSRAQPPDLVLCTIQSVWFNYIDPVSLAPTPGRNLLITSGGTALVLMQLAGCYFQTGYGGLRTPWLPHPLVTIWLAVPLCYQAAADRLILSNWARSFNEADSGA